MSRKTKAGDIGRLQDIVREADLLQTHLQGKAEEWLTNDEWACRAVEHTLQIIAEAAGHLSPDLQRRGEHLPWRQMAGMRIVLTHHYSAIDVATLWDTAVNDVPPLARWAKEQLHQLNTPDIGGQDPRHIPSPLHRLSDNDRGPDR